MDPLPGNLFIPPVFATSPDSIAKFNLVVGAVAFFPALLQAIEESHAKSPSGNRP
jgi:hypothetical protein